MFVIWRGQEARPGNPSQANNAENFQVDPPMVTISAKGIRFDFDPRNGLLDGFEVIDNQRRIAPLHRAPWVGTDEQMPPTAPPHLARLGGDFFCAPFSQSESGVPLHGWPANSDWSVACQSDGILRAVLAQGVQGATLIKELSVQDGHPFVYQRHVFIGGNGRISCSNHANLALPNGGLIRSSEKSSWETIATALESDPLRGRSALLYPAKATDPRNFPGGDGPVDLTRYPWGQRHEDFVIGLEARGHWLGWTAVARPHEGDLYLSLRNAWQLPMTMLWHSNGGRDYAPWSGRHFGCLGIEEAAAAHMLALSSEKDLAGQGALDLSQGGIASVLHVTGAIDWPSGEPVAEVEADTASITVRGDKGATRTVPCHVHLLAGQSA